MRKITVIILIFCLVPRAFAQAPGAQAAPNFTPYIDRGSNVQYSDLPKIRYNRDPLYYSEGYKLGFITSFVETYGADFVPWSYEGKMYQGYGSSDSKIIDPDCVARFTAEIDKAAKDSEKMRLRERQNVECVVFENPWSFSSEDARLYNSYNQLSQPFYTPVLVYRQMPLFTPKQFFTATKDYAYRIFPVNPDIHMPEKYELSSGSIPFATYILRHKVGYKEGRIVSASLDHLFRKSFEVVIQENEFGNKFQRMSVNDQGMFDYIIQAMLTGKMLHIGFIEISQVQQDFVDIPADYDTTYRVVSVQLQESMPKAK